MKRAKRMAVVVLAIAAVSALVWAQRPERPRMGHGFGAGPGAGRMAGGEARAGRLGLGDSLRSFGLIAQYLELTDEQKLAIRQAFEANRETASGLREELRAANLQLREALAASTPDPAAVGALMVQIHGLNGQLQDLRRATADSIRAVLTPEQLDKVETVKAAAPLEPMIQAFRQAGLIPPPEAPPAEFPEMP